jgi:hypothetical protein
MNIWGTKENTGAITGSWGEGLAIEHLPYCLGGGGGGLVL